MQKIGLIGYGKAGQAVASVLANTASLSLAWIAKRQPDTERPAPAPIKVALNAANFAALLDSHPVDAIIDFSGPETIYHYGAEAARRGISIISANSNHDAEQLALAKTLGAQTRIMCCPNITLGINFLLIAAKALQKMAPQVDVAIVEEHFRGKPEISGTAMRLASALGVPAQEITSLRLGGVIGHHEVVFGFPYQTVRLTHDSISREAFGTGAVFALSLLAKEATGYHQMEQLMLKHMLTELEQQAQPGHT